MVALRNLALLAGRIACFAATVDPGCVASFAASTVAGRRVGSVHATAVGRSARSSSPEEAGDDGQASLPTGGRKRREAGGLRSASSGAAERHE